MTLKGIQKLLDHYVPNPKIPLSFTSPYTLLIATLLSAQATDKKTNEVTSVLFQKAKTPEEMVKLPLHELEKILYPIGLYRTKAKNILALSKILVEKHEGKVPGSFSELEALPGIGHKTASVIMLHAFNTPAFPVDTHIFRLARRWKLSKGKTVEAVEKDLKRLFPKELWSTLHLQMILYGRKYCTAKGHTIANCPVCSLVNKTS